jgi:hypothetical protein
MTPTGMKFATNSVKIRQIIEKLEKRNPDILTRTHPHPHANSIVTAISSRGKIDANAVRTQPGIEPEPYTP